jgi:hypothetical protein
MRASFAAIFASFKGRFGGLFAALFWPFRALLGGGAGAGSMAVPEVAPPRPPSPALAVDNTQLYKRIAIALQKWAAESLLADERLPTPERWPRGIKEWAGGLDREELFAIIDGPQLAVECHISGLFAMPRLRKLQLLPAAAWPALVPMPDPGTGTPLTAAAAVGEPLSRRRRGPRAPGG